LKVHVRVRVGVRVMAMSNIPPQRTISFPKAFFLLNRVLIPPSTGVVRVRVKIRRKVRLRARVRVRFRFCVRVRVRVRIPRYRLLCAHHLSPNYLLLHLQGLPVACILGLGLGLGLSRLACSVIIRVRVRVRVVKACL